MKIYRILFITLVFSTIGYSQNVQPVRLEIERAIPGESFSNDRFEVDFWIQVENFTSIDLENTTLELLQDDTGKDLVAAHDLEVAKYNEETERLSKGGKIRFSSRTEPLFQPDRWDALRDTLGFKATISSGMTLPDVKASKVHIVMDISYNVEVGAGLDSTQIKVPSLYNSPTIIFQRKEIRLGSGGSMSRNEGERFHIYSIPKNKFPVAIKSISVLDEHGVELEKLSGMVGPNEFMVKDGKHKDPVVLSVVFKPIETKSIHIDKWINLGLSGTLDK